MLRSMQIALSIVGLIGLAMTAGCSGPSTPPTPNKQDLSLTAFAAMGKVLTHPRCLNCHPSSDSPTQGENLAAHQPPVTRGGDGRGAVGMRCDTCHTEGNVTLTERAGSIPGANGWHLAPRSMGWQGLSLGQICAQLKDPARNGGKTLDEVHQHLANDAFVGWAWSPGDTRAPAPGTRAEFVAQTRVWIDNGAYCPN